MNDLECIDRIAEQLSEVPGVVGVVLGGSRARGTHHAASDVDIGIYYDRSEGFDVANVDVVAARWDDGRRERLVTPLGGWGPWVDGGGWLVVQGRHVDFIFRDIDRVADAIRDGLEGKVSSHYHAGHPHAYLNVMYMGELAICRILADPSRRLARLKAKTAPYPKPLKDAIVRYFSFEASFSLQFAADNADKDDVSYVAGHAFRAISCMNQVLFALNEQYCVNEKKAVRMIEGFPLKPERYKNRIDDAVTRISSDPDLTRQAVDTLRELWRETEALIP